MSEGNKVSLSKKLSSTLQNKVAPAAAKLGEQRHLSAITSGLMATVPITILGGFMMIIAQPPVDPNMVEATNIFNRFLLLWHSWATKNSAVLNIPYNMTMSIISIYAVLGVSYNLAKSYKMNTISSSVIALLSFLVVAAPLEAVDPENPRALFMPANYLDAKGLFTALIVALLSVEITRFLYKKNIKIKMPESVPPMVTASFESLIPIIINVLIFLAINNLLLNTAGYSIPQAIMNIFTPLVAAVDSLGGIILAVTLINLLWVFGIHGGAIVNGVLRPFVLMNIAANAEAIIAGQPLENILSGSFIQMFANIGGSGAALGLGIAMLICAKSAQLKSVSRIGVTPAFFNISEPIVFGTPIIMNPILAIPVLIVPIINVIITYFAMSMNIVGKIYINTPFTTPGIINSFLSTMDWKAAILWCMLVVIDVIIFIPFVKVYDKVLMEKELKVKNS